MPAGLPASCWVLQRPPVESKKALNWADIIPNLVGNPKTNPSASESSLAVITGMSLFSGALIFPSTSSFNVSATCMCSK
ncbi:hypothetical protein Hanom_Chr05g00466501 [Helianthus anomalus]